jgi:hypothetical protein
MTNMAPMAGRVADGEEDGFVFCFSFFKSFITPWKPIDRIVCMLKKVRGFLMD